MVLRHRPSLIEKLYGRSTKLIPPWLPDFGNSGNMDQTGLNNEKPQKGAFAKFEGFKTFVEILDSPTPRRQIETPWKNRQAIA
jgi:hypothetical protein